MTMGNLKHFPYLFPVADEAPAFLAPYQRGCFPSAEAALPPRRRNVRLPRRRKRDSKSCRTMTSLLLLPQKTKLCTNRGAVARFYAKKTLVSLLLFRRLASASSFPPVIFLHAWKYPNNFFRINPHLNNIFIVP